MESRLTSFYHLSDGECRFLTRCQKIIWRHLERQKKKKGRTSKIAWCVASWDTWLRSLPFASYERNMAHCFLLSLPSIPRPPPSPFPPFVSDVFNSHRDPVYNYRCHDLPGREKKGVKLRLPLWTSIQKKNQKNPIGHSDCRVRDKKILRAWRSALSR